MNPEIDAARWGLLDPRALGVSLGTVGGASVIAATATLLVRGGELVGPTLGLLAEYFIGYSVSWPGTVVGGAYGFAVGFLIGYAFARGRNRLIRGYLRHLWRSSEREEVADLLDHLS